MQHICIVLLYLKIPSFGPLDEGPMLGDKDHQHVSIFAVCRKDRGLPTHLTSTVKKSLNKTNKTKR